MARALKRLNDLAARRAKKPGKYPDGGGLYLQVGRSGSKCWIFRFMLHGKEREMGLGSLNAVTLAQAREKATDARRLRAEGIDPIETKRAKRAAALLGAVTFKDAAARYVESHRAGWRNATHARQWETTLRTYAEPVLALQLPFCFEVTVAFLL
jgi:hypothetical protein